MENTLVLDSDILIDILREDPKTVSWFKENENKFELATTVINLFELYTGAYKSKDSENRIKDVEEIAKKLHICSFLAKHSLEAGRQRAELEKHGEMIDMRDIFIGSIALVEGFALKTNNKKHFSRIKGLSVLD